MASVEDIMNTLATQISAYVYPSGTGQPSVTGKVIKVYPGWPTSSSLDKDLQADNVNVSIFPSGPERNVTRYAPKNNVMSIAAATLTLTANKNVVTVGGTMPSPFTAHNLALLVENQPFIYSVQSTDTLTSIATGLAALIAVAFPGTTSSGPVITLPVNTIPVVARVGTTGVVTTEWERQRQRMQITVWAADPTCRMQVGEAIRAGFSQISFLTMPDGYGARVLSAGSTLSDILEKAKTYRRDLFYDVEYATTVSQTIATVVATTVTYETQDGVPIITRTF
ncbi:MAG: hypothetical protein PW999_10010 [Paraburkholderia tropica]|nr:hypothetical protein [Paraburkholderia tropica]